MDNGYHGAKWCGDIFNGTCYLLILSLDELVADSWRDDSVGSIGVESVCLSRKKEVSNPFWPSVQFDVGPLIFIHLV